MTLPVSGNPIKASQINTEEGVSSTAQINIGGSAPRGLAGVASGTISFSNFLSNSYYSAYGRLYGGTNQYMIMVR
jgi:hypothetical protein